MTAAAPPTAAEISAALRDLGLSSRDDDIVSRMLEEGTERDAVMLDLKAHEDAERQIEDNRRKEEETRTAKNAERREYYNAQAARIGKRAELKTKLEKAYAAAMNALRLEEEELKRRASEAEKRAAEEAQKALVASRKLKCVRCGQKYSEAENKHGACRWHTTQACVNAVKKLHPEIADYDAKADVGRALCFPLLSSGLEWDINHHQRLYMCCKRSEHSPGCWIGRHSLDDPCPDLADEMSAWEPSDLTDAVPGDRDAAYVARIVLGVAPDGSSVLNPKSGVLTRCSEPPGLADEIRRSLLADRPPPAGGGLPPEILQKYEELAKGCAKLTSSYIKGADANFDRDAAALEKRINAAIRVVKRGRPADVTDLATGLAQDSAEFGRLAKEYNAIVKRMQQEGEKLEEFYREVISMTNVVGLPAETYIVKANAAANRELDVLEHATSPFEVKVLLKPGADADLQKITADVAGEWIDLMRSVITGGRGNGKLERKISELSDDLAGGRWAELRAKLKDEDWKTEIMGMLLKTPPSSAASTPELPRLEEILRSGSSSSSSTSVVPETPERVLAKESQPSSTVSESPKRLPEIPGSAELLIASNEDKSLDLKTFDKVDSHIDSVILPRIGKLFGWLGVAKERAPGWKLAIGNLESTLKAIQEKVREQRGKNRVGEQGTLAEYQMSGVYTPSADLNRMYALLIELKKGIEKDLTTYLAALPERLPSPPPASIPSRGPTPMTEEPPLTPITPEQSPVVPSSTTSPPSVTVPAPSPPVTVPAPPPLPPRPAAPVPVTVPRIDEAKLGELVMDDAEVGRLIETKFKSSPVNALVDAMRKIRDVIGQGKQLNWLPAFAKMAIDQRASLEGQRQKQIAFTKDVIAKLTDRVDAFAISSRGDADITTLLKNAKKLAGVMNK